MKISEFKTHCIRILKTLKRRGKPLTITIRGKALAIIYPTSDQKKKRELGGQRGNMKIHCDLVGQDFSSEWESLHEDSA